MDGDGPSCGHVDEADAEGDTPLHIACRRDNVMAAKALLEMGASQCRARFCVLQ